MKALKKFVFPERRGLAESKYNWDKLLDGTIYQLEKGVDYECNDQTMRMMAYKQGRKRGKSVQVAKNEVGLVLQATEVDEATKAEWAAADVARASKAKEKKASQTSEETTPDEADPIEE